MCIFICTYTQICTQTQTHICVCVCVCVCAQCDIMCSVHSQNTHAIYHEYHELLLTGQGDLRKGFKICCHLWTCTSLLGYGGNLLSIRMRRLVQYTLRNMNVVHTFVVKFQLIFTTNLQCCFTGTMNAPISVKQEWGLDVNKNSIRGWWSNQNKLYTYIWGILLY